MNLFHIVILLTGCCVVAFGLGAVITRYVLRHLVRELDRGYADWSRLRSALHSKNQAHRDAWQARERVWELHRTAIDQAVTEHMSAAYTAGVHAAMAHHGLTVPHEGGQLAAEYRSPAVGIPGAWI